MLIDARLLSEKQPTGVPLVARQFITALKNLRPDAHELQARDSWSNTWSNWRLWTHTNTLENLAGCSPRWIFSPNIGFRNLRASTKILQLVHDLSFLHTPFWFSPKMRWWHRLLNAKKHLQQSAQLIAVSRWTAQDLQQHLAIPAERITVISPYTPTPVPAVKPQFLPLGDAPFFLFLGTVERRKNISGIIAAFEKIKTTPACRNHHLLLVGRRGYGAPEKLPERVYHLPYVNEAAKWWLYDHATAFVYPSFFEGFGLPPLEAAAAKCPVIVSDITALPETMGNAALEVSPFSINEIALAMEAFATDEILRARYIVRGTERAAFFTAAKQHLALQTLLAKIDL